MGNSIRSSITPPPPLSETEIEAAKKAVNELLGSHNVEGTSSHKSAGASSQASSVIEFLDAQDAFEGGLSGEEQSNAKEQFTKAWEESGLEDEDTPSDNESEGE